jgi:hypothetical protein
MSTVFRIQVDAAPSNAENVIRQAFEEVERLETVLSEWRDGRGTFAVAEKGSIESVDYPG